MKLKNGLLTAGLFLFISTTACAGDNSGGSETASVSVPSTEASASTPTSEPSSGILSELEKLLPSVASSYEEVFDEYSEKIINATPPLIDEYNQRAAEHVGDMETLAEIANETVEKLALILLQGTEKMAEYMLSVNDDYNTYEEWAGKLTDVYLSESVKIMDAYLNISVFGL